MGPSLSRPPQRGRGREEAVTEQSLGLDNVSREMFAVRVPFSAQSRTARHSSSVSVLCSSGRICSRVRGLSESSSRRRLMCMFASRRKSSGSLPAFSRSRMPGVISACDAGPLTYLHCAMRGREGCVRVKRGGRLKKGSPAGGGISDGGADGPAQPRRAGLLTSSRRLYSTPFQSTHLMRGRGGERWREAAGGRD